MHAQKIILLCYLLQYYDICMVQNFATGFQRLCSNTARQKNERPIILLFVLAVAINYDLHCLPTKTLWMAKVTRKTTNHESTSNKNTFFLPWKIHVLLSSKSKVFFLRWSLILVKIGVKKAVCLFMTLKLADFFFKM